MTDRYDYITVILEKDIREDDAAAILIALKMIKGVISVRPNIADPNSYMAEERARMKLEKKLLEIIFPKENRG